MLFKVMTITIVMEVATTVGGTEVADTDVQIVMGTAAGTGLAEDPVTVEADLAEPTLFT